MERRDVYDVRYWAAGVDADFGCLKEKGETGGYLSNRLTHE